MITWIGAAFVLLAGASVFLVAWGLTYKGGKQEAFGERLKPMEAKSKHSVGIWRDQVSTRLQGAAERVDKVNVKKGKASMADTLAQADIRMRTSEYMMIKIAMAASLGGIALWRWGIIQAIVVAFLTYLAPNLYVKYRTGQRLRSFNRQLPQTLNMIANGLKAGYSLPQALENVAETAESPTGEEFGKAIREVNLGGSIDDALAHLVRRVSSEDLDLVVTAILVHRNVGGNLAEILSTIGHTIRERIRIRGEIRTLTAQARLSGVFISVIPVGLGVLLYFIAPSYFGPMTSNVLGWAMLLGAGIMIAIGNVVMRKFVAIEI